MCKLSFGTGVTRYWCPCSKSNLQNSHHVAWWFSGVYTVWIGGSIYELSVLEDKNNSRLRLFAPLLAISIIGFISTRLLTYGIKSKIKWILVSWIMIAQLNTVFWTIGYLVRLQIGFWTLYLLVIWFQSIYGRLIVYSGIQEIENESSQNMHETQLQNV